MIDVQHANESSESTRENTAEPTTTLSGKSSTTPSQTRLSAGSQALFSDMIQSRSVADADLRVNLFHPHRSPPVRFAHQLHERGHEQHADDGRVDDQRDDHADAQELHH